MRNVEKTKVKILEAAQNLLASGGFSALKVNALAEEAGVGKPLIYRYFKNMDGVGKALAEKVWAPKPQMEEINPSNAVSGDILIDLISHGRLLGGDRSMRDMLVWSLASNDSPGAIEIEVEQPLLNELQRGLSPENDKVAIYALLKAAIAFLVLYRDRNETWVGLRLKTPNEMVRFEYAMADIVQKFWSKG